VHIGQVTSRLKGEWQEIDDTFYNYLIDHHMFLFDRRRLTQMTCSSAVAALIGSARSSNDCSMAARVRGTMS
jgi:hypothetical protein